MLLVWLQILLVKLVCLSMMEYVGGGDSSPLEVFERFAAVPVSLYKPAAPSVSDIDRHRHRRVAKQVIGMQVRPCTSRPGQSQCCMRTAMPLCRCIAVRSVVLLWSALVTISVRFAGGGGLTSPTGQGRPPRGGKKFWSGGSASTPSEQFQQNH